MVESKMATIRKLLDQRKWCEISHETKQMMLQTTFGFVSPSFLPCNSNRWL
jgi:hypothetical protein